MWDTDSRFCICNNSAIFSDTNPQFCIEVHMDCHNKLYNDAITKPIFATDSRFCMEVHMNFSNKLHKITFVISKLRQLLFLWWHLNLMAELYSYVGYHINVSANKGGSWRTRAGPSTSVWGRVLTYKAGPSFVCHHILCDKCHIITILP